MHLGQVLAERFMLEQLAGREEWMKNSPESSSVRMPDGHAHRIYA
jgi:hypothetical protein